MIRPPGTPWYDTQGKLIQAHGGGVIKHEDTWYWYGEDKTHGYYPSVGVACYSSKNLSEWKFESLACPNWIQDGRSIVPGTPEPFVSETERPVIERPKVIFNKKTKRFVMWMHLEGYNPRTSPNPSYQFSQAGVAISDKPTGPFQFIGTFRPVPAHLHKLYSEDASADQMQRGSTFRDMTLFVDEDESAYVVYAAEGNPTAHIIKLTEDYLRTETPVLGENWGRVHQRESREAPVLFKSQGKYHLITSGCTGWTPNAGLHSVSENILGIYKPYGNPFKGKDAEISFGTQGTYFISLGNERFVLMCDKWIGENISHSPYIWLPFKVMPSGIVEIHWSDSWSIDDKK